MFQAREAVMIYYDGKAQGFHRAIRSIQSSNLLRTRTGAAFMLAISVRQPWAELILTGRKTVEVRKSTTKQRGPLLIHAAGIRGAKEFNRASIDPSLRDSYLDQCLIGIVTLANIIRLNDELWDQLRAEHLLPGRWLMEDHKYAWFLRHPTRIRPIHYLGLPRSFFVPDELLPKAIRNLPYPRREIRS
jgi:hypothetical protein